MKVRRASRESAYSAASGIGIRRSARIHQDRRERVGVGRNLEAAGERGNLPVCVSYGHRIATHGRIGSNRYICRDLRGRAIGARIHGDASAKIANRACQEIASADCHGEIRLRLHPAVGTH